MAEVNDRGQLLLVGGIVLAVFFVALALLVNTAIYTDNVATRGGDSAAEALDYQDGVVTAVGGLLDAENANESNTDVEGIETAVESGTTEIDAAMERQHLRRGAATNVSVGSISENTTEGLLIQQTDADNFENWTVNASAVRRFVIEFNASTGDGFGIELNDTSLDFNFSEDSNDLVIEQDGVDLCSADNNESVRFDVTAQRINGEPCPFEWPELDDDEISFENGDTAAGSYELTVDSDDETDEVGSGNIATEAVYSINELGLRYDSPDVSYETTVRIAPGEPDV